MTLPLVVQLALLPVAGWGVFLLWRRTASRIVAAGLLARAIVGQLAFWISYLRLPFAESLQVGDGFWLFALDAVAYCHRAAVAAEHGPLAILAMPRGVASVAYVRLLAAAMWLLGSVLPVAILLNLAAYLGCCAIIQRLGGNRIALAAISFSPAVLWSAQPLKDVPFLFFIAAVIAALHAWRLPLAVAMNFLVAGIRWYVGMMVTFAAVPFVFLIALRDRKRIAAGVAVLPLLFLAVITGSAWMPYPMRGRTHDPRALLETAEWSAFSFDVVGGASMIVPGRAVATLARTPQRIVTGVAAMTLPRFICQAAGLLTIGGGRGMWPFVELDTLAFDALLIAAAVAIVRSRGARPPAFWLALLVTAMLAGALAYTVSNFGTLFRHREMVRLGLALVLTLARGRQIERAG